MIIKEKFEAILTRLVTSGKEGGPLTGIEIADQFLPTDKTAKGRLRNLNAAFIISLCGKSHPSFPEAEDFIKELGYLAIARRMIDEYAIDGLILGCTEIPLLLKEEKYYNIPFLNTSKIHAESAFRYCLGEH